MNINPHSKLVNDTILIVGGSKYARCWKAHVGLFRDLDDDERCIKVGLKGQADITGFMLDGTGRRLEMECKTGNAVLSKQQRRFRKVIEACGAVYILVRCPKQALKDIKRAARYPGALGRK